MKITNDILKENGIYSIKRVMAIIILIFDLLLGVFIVISDKILDKVVNPYAIMVFNSLLAAVMTLVVASVIDKKFTTKTEV
ncbi:MAG: hypothetical protein H7Y10_03575 [Flavobacterium sp.]|nr:hypothetical protein [Flavobacterium sp.]